MPLRDHFHLPLSSRPWESFHDRWANAIGDYLNDVLPRRYVSEIHMHWGSQVAADVAEVEHLDVVGDQEGNGPTSAAAVAVQTWVPPAATTTLPLVYPDDLEVRVNDQRDDARLVAVVELVSPRNKDRAEARRAFAAKCAAYLQRGIGLITVDVVTERRGNLHNELVRLLNLDESLGLAADTSLYAVAYRPSRQNNADVAEVWSHALSVGGVLPLLPLALLGARPVPLDLEATYKDACRRSRID
jgi:hypothetical protein